MRLMTAHTSVRIAAALTVLVAVGADLLARAHSAHVALIGVVALALGVVRTRSVGRHRRVFGVLSALVVAQPALHAAWTLSAPGAAGSGLHDLGPDSLATMGNMVIAVGVAGGVGATEMVLLAFDAALRSCWSAVLALLAPTAPATAPLPLAPSEPVRPRPRVWTRHRARRGPPMGLARV